MSMIRTRWAALGAAVAITLGGGGIGLVDATVSTGEKPVLVPITPCRLLDTRPVFQVGPRDTPLGAADTYTVPAHGTNGDCTIPADALGLSLNVTAVGATLPTFLTIWATNEPMPNASSLNPEPGQPPAPNAVTTELSTDGGFDIYNLQGEVHVLADVNGYYADHDHADLYYTRAEARARFVDAQPFRVRLSPHEMHPNEDGTNWAFGWEHSPSGTTTECLSGRVELPIGATVSGLSIVYTAPAPDPTVAIVLAAKRTTAGALVGSVLPPIVGTTLTAPSTNGFESKNLVLPASSGSAVLEDYDYTVGICTADAFTVYGAEVALSYLVP